MFDQICKYERFLCVLVCVLSISTMIASLPAPPPFAHQPNSVPQESQCKDVRWLKRHLTECSFHTQVFRIRTPTEAINLVSLLLEYTPSARITPLKACAHPFFDELRMEGNHTLPNGRDMPPLFNFTEHGE